MQVPTVRGSVAFSKLVAHFCTKARVGLHPACVVEQRSTAACRGGGHAAASGVGLFVREACDAGTVLSVVPQDAVVSLPALRQGSAIAPRFDHPVRAAVAEGFLSEGSGDGRALRLLAALFGFEAMDGAAALEMVGVVEFAYRIAVEHCAGASSWSHWLSLLPTSVDMEKSHHACEATIRARHPQMLAAWKEGGRDVARAIQVFYDVMREAVLIPPLAAFEWAMRTVLARSRTLLLDTQPSPDGSSSSGHLSAGIAIAPVIDFCNASPLIMVPPADLASLLRAAEHQAPEEVSQSLFRLARRNPFLGLDKAALASASRRGSHGREGAGLGLPAAAVEVAADWDELPTWYREELEEARALRGVSGTMTSRDLDGLFPALVLTLSQDAQAGDEVSLLYDPACIPLAQSGGTSAADGYDSNERHAMATWLRYDVAF